MFCFFFFFFTSCIKTVDNTEQPRKCKQVVVIKQNLPWGNRFEVTNVLARDKCGLLRRNHSKKEWGMWCRLMEEGSRDASRPTAVDSLAGATARPPLVTSEGTSHHRSLGCAAQGQRKREKILF